MVGGRDFYITQQKINFYNRAIQSQRQPGSAFKPIVFAAMLDMPPLVTPATIISDEAWSTESEVGVKWEPRNIEGEFHGDVTVRKILVKSINVATAKMMWETPKDEHKKPEGLKRTLALAERLGAGELQGGMDRLLLHGLNLLAQNLAGGPSRGRLRKCRYALAGRQRGRDPPGEPK